MASGDLALQKSARRDGLLILFIDETSFRFDPIKRNSWAPAKNPPILRPAPGNDRVSSIVALIYDPQTRTTDLVFRLQRSYYNRYTVAAFLEAIVTEFDRDVLAILDNWEPHRLAIEYLGETKPATASRLAVAYFPTDTPNLNPPEQLWTHIKYGRMANYLPNTVDQLHAVRTNFSQRFNLNRKHYGTTPSRQDLHSKCFISIVIDR